jgi:hypothetical protein
MSIKKLQACLLLELLYAATKRRLTQVNALGGAGEVAFFR